MQLKSESFLNQQMMPKKFTCKGNNISPALGFTNVSDKTASLALVVHDPDSPSGNFVHWLMWNIPAHTQVLDEGSVPAGAVQGINDFGQASYGGPCPHSGTHRYIFSLFALDRTLDLPQTTTRQELLDKLNDHILEQTALTGLFSADSL
jgi:Raf kinase inhibitor-like YbhB/YbcL family protein